LSTILEIIDLTKHYGALTAVKKLSLQVTQGEILGLLGPNGAGKTTIIHMICGLLKPDEGSIVIQGTPANQNRQHLHLIGLCPQNIILWEKLTCIEQLQFMGEMYGMKSSSALRAGDNLLISLDLLDKRDMQACTLSGGMRRRLFTSHWKEVERMIFLHVLRKCLREQYRNLLELSLTLVFAPVFILFYYLILPSGSTTYSVLVQNLDNGSKYSDTSLVNAGTDFIETLKKVQYANANPILKVSLVTDPELAKAKLRERDATVIIIISPGFSKTLQNFRETTTAGGIVRSLPPAPVTFIGDLTNPYYAIAAVIVNAALDEYVQSFIQQSRPVQIIEQPLGGSGTRTEFDIYIPGLIIFSIIMLVFSASMSVTREVESGIITRLKLSRMTAFDYLAGISISLLLVGMTSIFLTLLTAYLLGFRSQGPWWIIILVGVLTSFSIIGTGLIVASFSKTITQAFLIANFPLGFYMFFSGSIFPLPRSTLFSIAGHAVGILDWLPPTHAVNALNEVCTLGNNLGGIAYEMSSLLILSVIYFAIGVWVFNHKHLRVVN
jgi:ABC-2 type transport system permease protein